MIRVGGRRMVVSAVVMIDDEQTDPASTRPKRRERTELELEVFHFPLSRLNSIARETKKRL